MRALLAGAPTSAFLVVALGWVLGSLAGGWAAARMAGRAPVPHALALGSLILLASIGNNMMLPPPTWFWFVSLAFLLPAAYLGGRLGSRPAERAPPST